MQGNASINRSHLTFPEGLSERGFPPKGYNNVLTRHPKYYVTSWNRVSVIGFEETLSASKEFHLQSVISLSRRSHQCVNTSDGDF